MFGQQEYQIARSLRFNAADSAYLSRTPASTGNRTTWTWSGWIKRARLGLTAGIFGAGTDNATARTLFWFQNTEKIIYQQGDTVLRTTDAVFRDTNAWGHLVVTVDNGNAVAADRIILYWNGNRLTTTGSGDPGTTQMNTLNVAMKIGTRTNPPTSEWFDGYMAEVNFIDGQALTPSSFGETSPTTGVWIPKRYTGTYGTNGFYLSFANNASTTTLGYDDAGGIAGSGAGSNDWTLNNFSVTAGVGNDSLTDSPTNNFWTLNPLDVNSATFGDGNLRISGGSSNSGQLFSPALPTTGKWYWEINIVTVGTVSCFGVAKWDSTNANAFHLGATSTQWAWYNSGATSGAYTNNILTTYGTAVTSGDIVGVAFDIDNGTLEFYKNGVSQGVAFTGLTIATYTAFKLGIDYRTAGTANLNYLNTGQRPFAYTPPSGYKALNTQNLPTPTILNGSKFMNAVTWTGTGATRSITGVGFQPDLVWSKSRSNAETHKLVDSTRGATKALSSVTTGDEVTESGITSFDADGFTIDGATDTGYNTNTYTYVGWSWKKGVTPGFDIVTYTGNGSARTISHSLGAVPHFMIVKARTTAGTDQGWPVYHRNNTTAPETDYLLLNSTAATADLDTIWNDTAPTSSVFSVGTNALVNTNNDTYLAYLWTEISGFSRFGSYTGNGSTDGPFVYTGFNPKYVMIKLTSQAGFNWMMFDTARGTINPVGSYLFGNQALVEGSATYLDINANGFKLRANNVEVNNTSDTYIYAAFAETSFKYSRSR